MTTKLSRLQDRIEIAVGIWLLVSPWLLGFARPFAAAAATANTGAAIPAAPALNRNRRRLTWSSGFMATILETRTPFACGTTPGAPVRFIRQW